MVKADVKRDYYGDLALSPSAETETIKKQFRKLALKYHPDRNPGREVEFIAKFQAIQAAHEILTDPQQRLKYDTDRLRAGYGKLYGPPKSDFPPRPSNTTKFSAPRRAPTATQPPRPQASASYQTPPSTGAHRYASYAKAGGAKWEQPYDEAQTRADAFRGFQNMKANSGGASRGGNPAWSKFDPRTGQASAYQATADSWARSGTMPGGQKPRQQQSAYDPFSGKAGTNQQYPGMSRSQSTAKKKQGFAPGDPGGDEPMAKNTSAYVNVPRERPHSTYFEPAPSPTAKKSPLRSQQPTVEEELPKTPFTPSYTERTGNRYANTGGEKTYFGRAGLDRSASVRNPTATQNNAHVNPTSPLSPTGSRSRHHSASPKLRPDRSRPFSSSDSSDTDGSPAERPKVVPMSRLRRDKLKRGFFAQYNKNQDSGETFQNSMPSDKASYGGNGTSTSQNPNPFQESKAQEGNNKSSNVNANFTDKTKDDEWERSKTAQDHINDTWGFPRRGSLKKSETNPNADIGGHPKPSPNGNSNPNMRTSGVNGTPGSMNNSTMYDPFHKDSTKTYSRKWSEQWGFSTPPSASAPKKPPLWAYPSSVLPQHMVPKQGAKEAKPPAAVNPRNPSLADSFLRSLPPDAVPSLSSLPSLNHTFKSVNADPLTRDNSFSNHATAYAHSNQQPLYADGQSPMKSRSHESMNTTFSANDWNGKFEGTSGFFVPKPSSSDEHQRSSRRTRRVSPNRGRTNGRPRSASQSNSGAGSYTSAQSQHQPTSSQQQQGSAPFAEAKFSADKWAQELKDNTWTFPSNEARTTQQPATDRHPSPKKQTKTTKQRTNVPKPASVSVEVDGEEEIHYANSQGNSHSGKGYVDGGNSGGEAMDIDDDIPATKGPAGVNSGPTVNVQQGEPRLVSVEPNNPEWRASARQGQQQPPPGTRSTPAANGAADGNPLNTANSANNLFNLSKLNNVAPFMTTNSTGINDLNDLNTSLPFESAPGNTPNSNIGSRPSVRPSDLALPKPPKTPLPPRFTSESNSLDPVQQQRPILTQKSWERYVAEMGAYMSEWNAFNRKMLAHFKARQETVETGLHPRWIGAVGDTSRLNVDAEFSLEADSGKGPDGAADSAESLVAGSAKGGFNAYLRGIDEDVVVRKHWDVAWERHRACIIALGEVKDRIRAGGRLGR